jgi:hypothetical protein
VGVNGAAHSPRPREVRAGKFDGSPALRGRSGAQGVAARAPWQRAAHHAPPILGPSRSPPCLEPCVRAGSHRLLLGALL